MGEIDQPVILRGRFNVTVYTGKIAQCTGIEPKRLKLGHANPRALFSLGCNFRMRKLAVFFKVGIIDDKIHKDHILRS